MKRTASHCSRKLIPFKHETNMRISPDLLSTLRTLSADHLWHKSIKSKQTTHNLDELKGTFRSDSLELSR